MKTKVLTLIVLIFFAVSSLVTAQTAPHNVDLEKVASDLVNQCANISEGEMVLVSGGIKDLELLENIVTDVRKKGAFPLLTINSDRMDRKDFVEVPEKYDSQAPEMGMNLVKFITSNISVSYSEKPGLLADIPPERFARRGEASKPLQDYLEKNPMKSVALGNGMYPTQANADEFGISLDKLNEIFWSGINVDYKKLSSVGNKLMSILANGDELKIKNKNGTDLTVKITSCSSYCSDGVIDEEDMSRGIAGYSVYLPAGEVYLAPVKGSANGKIVVDNYTFMGKPVKGLILEFENGKLVSMDAKSNLESLKRFIDTQGDGMKEFSMVDFGINPNVVIPEGSKFTSWMPAGMITIGIGNNIWSGGDNDANAVLGFFIPGCTVQLDGDTLVDGGVLKL